MRGCRRTSEEVDASRATLDPLSGRARCAVLFWSRAGGWPSRSPAATLSHWRLLPRTGYRCAMSDPDRATELQARLMDTADPGDRARIHLELGRLALSDGRLDGAVRHLREAILLDPRLDAARTLLQDLGAASRTSFGAGGGRRAAVRALLGRFAGRRGD